MLFISMLYACNDGKDARPLMDQWAKLGGEGGRWFASPLTPSSTRTGNTIESSEERSPQIATWLAERGLRGHAAGFCDTASWKDWGKFESHARWFGRLLRDHKLIGEVINEHQHSSQYDFSIGEIDRIVGWIRESFSGPLTAGAWLKADELVSGEYRPALVSRCDGLDTHFQRTNDPAWDMANHGFAELRVIQETYPGRWRMSGEPKRTDDGPVWPPRVFPYLLGIEAQGFNTHSTLHLSQGRDCNVLTGEQLEDAKAFLRGGKLLPRGRYHYENAGWGGSPVRNAAFCEWGPAKPPTAETKAVWRVHCYRHESTGQWFMVTYGPDALNPVIEFQNGFQYDKEIDRLDQYVVAHTLKQG